MANIQLAQSTQCGIKRSINSYAATKPKKYSLSDPLSPSLLEKWSELSIHRGLSSPTVYRKAQLLASSFLNEQGYANRLGRASMQHKYNQCRAHFCSEAGWLSEFH